MQRSWLEDRRRLGTYGPGMRSRCSFTCTRTKRRRRSGDCSAYFLGHGYCDSSDIGRVLGSAYRARWRGASKAHGVALEEGDMAPVPVSDQRWAQILEGAGLTTHPPRRELRQSWRWAWCDQCSAVVPVDRWSRWPTNADVQKGSPGPPRHAAMVFDTGATVRDSMHFVRRDGRS
jgi:hypothetical protein